MYVSSIVYDSLSSFACAYACTYLQCVVVKACSEEYPDQVCAHACPGATAPRGTPQRAEARRGTVRKGTYVLHLHTYVHMYVHIRIRLLLYAYVCIIRIHTHVLYGIYTYVCMYYTHPCICRNITLCIYVRTYVCYCMSTYIRTRRMQSVVGQAWVP